MIDPKHVGSGKTNSKQWSIAILPVSILFLNFKVSRLERLLKAIELLQTKYAEQHAKFLTTSINVHCPWHQAQYLKLQFSELFRDKMKTPIAFMLGLLLTNVACLPKDVAAKVTQKTETEELSRDRRFASRLLNTTSYSLHKHFLEYFIILLL